MGEGEEGGDVPLRCGCCRGLLRGRLARLNLSPPVLHRSALPKELVDIEVETY
jgi:hypothetical protein